MAHNMQLPNATYLVLHKNIRSTFIANATKNKIRKKEKYKEGTSSDLNNTLQPFPWIFADKAFCFLKMHCQLLHLLKHNPA